MSGITRDDLRAMANFWVDPTTGEVVSAEEGIQTQRERTRAARAAALNSRRDERGRARQAPTSLDGTDTSEELEASASDTSSTDSFSDWQREQQEEYEQRENAPHSDEPADSTLIGAYLLAELESMIISYWRGSETQRIAQLLSQLKSAYSDAQIGEALLAASEAGHVVDRKIFYDGTDATEFINFLREYFSRARVGDSFEALLQEAQEAEYVEDYDG